MTNPEEKTVFETTVSRPTTTTFLIIGVAGVIAIAACIAVIGSHSSQSEDAVLTRFWGPIGIFACYLLLISPFIVNYLKMGRIKWTVTNQRLIIKRGNLFRNAYYHLTADQIFKATYNQDLVSKWFNFGTVYVQQNVGLGTSETQIRLKKPLECVQAINQLVSDYKQSVQLANSVSYASPETSSVDELEKLIGLRDAGKISEEDFQLFKTKLLK